MPGITISVSMPRPRDLKRPRTRSSGWRERPGLITKGLIIVCAFHSRHPLYVSIGDLVFTPDSRLYAYGSETWLRYQPAAGAGNQCGLAYAMGRDLTAV